MTHGVFSKIKQYVKKQWTIMRHLSRKKNTFLRIERGNGNRPCITNVSDSTWVRRSFNSQPETWWCDGERVHWIGSTCVSVEHGPGSVLFSPITLTGIGFTLRGFWCLFFWGDDRPNKCRKHSVSKAIRCSLHRYDFILILLCRLIHCQK